MLLEGRVNNVSGPAEKSRLTVSRKRVTANYVPPFPLSRPSPTGMIDTSFIYGLLKKSQPARVDGELGTPRRTFRS